MPLTNFTEVPFTFFKGSWVAGEYLPGSIVTYSGSLYYADAQTSQTPGAGADWLVLMPQDAGIYAAYGGTANAITLATGKTYTTVPTGAQIRFRATAANTAATTVAVDGLSTVAVKTVTGVALPADYIRTDVDTTIRFDGTDWIASRAVENGSGSGGEFTRWENGAMICSEQLTSDATVDTVWTFEKAFSAAPRASINAKTTGARFGNSHSVTATALDFNAWNTSGARTATVCMLIAHGDWY